MATSSSSGHNDHGNNKVNIKEAIKVIGVTGDAEDPKANTDQKGTFHTEGMTKFGLPEMEIVGVPLFLGSLASFFLNATADWLLNGNGKIIEGHKLSIGDHPPITFRQHTYDNGEVRWRFTDEALVGECAMCKAGKHGHGDHSVY